MESGRMALVSRATVRGSVAILSSIAASACGALDRLLEVELPGQIEASAAEVPAKAATLVNGGITLFNCALTWHIIYGGALGDELTAGPGGHHLGDDRATFLEQTLRANEEPNCWLYYSSIAEARWQNDHVLTLLERWSDAEVANRPSLIARAAAYAGYSHLLLGEGFCSAAVDGGPELSSAQVIVRAEARFTQAIEAATPAGEAGLVNLARVGRARARLFLGKLAEARADAELVPQGFVRLAQYPATATRVNENNVIYLFSNGVDYTVDPLYRDVRFDGVADPRVGVVNSGRLSRYGQPIWLPAKYPTNRSPIRLASWEEAQLIVAEAEVAAGNLPAAVAIINQLHAKVGLPPFSSASRDEVLAQIVYERRAEFFLEGHHIADFRRYPLPLVPAAGTPYYGVAGVTYGEARCFPFPLSERSTNPNAR